MPIRLIGDQPYSTIDPEAANRWISSFSRQCKIMLAGSSRQKFCFAVSPAILQYLGIASSYCATPRSIHTLAAAGNYFLVFPRTGTITTVDNGRHFAGNPHRAVLFSPNGDSHTIFSEDYNAITIRIPAPLIQGAAAGLAGGWFTEAFRPMAELDQQGLVGHLLWQIISELECENNLFVQNTLWAQDRQLEFVEALAQLIPSNIQCWLERRSTELPGPLIRKAMDIMAARVREPFQEAEIAHRLGVSVKKLQESFAHESTCFRDEKLRLRAQAACVRLKHSDQSVESVALEFGFKNTGVFAGYCQRMCGCLPSKVRPA